MQVINITEGFTYKDRRYGWIEKKLYRLPKKEKNYLSFMEIMPKTINGNEYYRCSGDHLSIKRVAELTEKVEWSITQISSKNTPF